MRMTAKAAESPTTSTEAEAGENLVNALQPLVCVSSCPVRDALRAISFLEVLYLVTTMALFLLYRGCHNTVVCLFAQMPVVVGIFSLSCALWLSATLLLLNGARTLSLRMVACNLAIHIALVVKFVTCCSMINWALHMHHETYTPKDICIIAFSALMVVSHAWSASVMYTCFNYFRFIIDVERQL
uniref:MARVEL domain-containing protein n=1 Tax=Trichuris muris TaxID=70415 RepID=A0A5S6QTF0_TRIMR